MIDSYEKLNNSLKGFFSKIPNHWSIERNRDLMSITKVLVGEEWKEYKLLSLSLDGVVYRDIDSGKGKFPDSFEDYQKVEPNNLIFCLYDVDETPRTIGLSRLHGMISGSYKVMTCNSKVLPEYLFYFYRSIDDVKGLRYFYSGLRNVIRPETFLNIKIPIPPISEQKKLISEFKKTDDEISNSINSLKRKLDLTSEYKKSLFLEKINGKLNRD